VARGLQQPEIIAATPNKEAYPTYLYLERGLISVEIRNLLHRRIIVEKLLCRFIEAKPKVTLVSDFRPFPIESGHSGDASVIFRVPISCPPQTNYCRLGLQYRELGRKTITIWPNSQTARPYIIVQNIPKRREFFFISHKSKENTLLARSLKLFLDRVGFGGYIAEDEEKPGLMNYWSDKIYPAIKTSTAVVVLWTKIAQKHCRNIMREVEYAKKPDVSRERYVLASFGTSPNPVSPKDSKEYVRFDESNSDSRMIQLVKIIYDDFHDGSLLRSADFGTSSIISK
jgi:hypothetical protein